MNIHHLRHIAELGPALSTVGARHVVISPGSRNAPLIQLFTSKKDFICHSIVDERSAGYVALGMAKQLGEPVVLITTSGTAVLNLSPALAEAYEQQLPLLVLTADRPREILSSFNNQVFDQRAPYFNYSKGFFEFSAEMQEEEELEKGIRSALLMFMEALAYPPGPVHMNLPLSEPLYVPLPDPLLSPESIIREVEAYPSFGQSQADPDLNGKKVLVLAGMGKGNAQLQKILEKLPAVVVAENISNMFSEHFISVPELVLAAASETERAALHPDLLITFGQQVVSKRLKLFLHSLDKLEIRELAADDKDLTAFFKRLGESTKDADGYRRLWKQIENRACGRSENYIKEAGFGNLSAVARIQKALPSGSHLHLGNSSTIRLSQLIPARPDLNYYANRGISGIDGSLSSAVGAAMVSEHQHVLILGDLSFVYDSNALWNKDFPGNLKIVVLNDGGGGIFRLLEGPDRMDFFEEFSVTHHPVSLELLSGAFGRLASRATSMEELEQHLPALWSPGHGISVLEVDSSGCDNSLIYKDLFNKVK